MSDAVVVDGWMGGVGRRRAVLLMLDELSAELHANKALRMGVETSSGRVVWFRGFEK
jgi:hypothetical protein